MLSGAQLECDGQENSRAFRRWKRLWATIKHFWSLTILYLSVLPQLYLGKLKISAILGAVDSAWSIIVCPWRSTLEIVLQFNNRAKLSFYLLMRWPITILPALVFTNLIIINITSNIQHSRTTNLMLNQPPHSLFFERLLRCRVGRNRCIYNLQAIVVPSIASVENDMLFRPRWRYYVLTGMIGTAPIVS